MRRGTLFGLSFLILVSVLAAYRPALQAGFVWNDDTYLTENPVLDRPDALSLIWTEPRASEQYYPLVFTTFWIEKQLWGLHPFGYHLVNVLLHAGSALLLWLFLTRLKLRGGFFAAMLFALHPVSVESVAWVTERKNTLSLFLSLLAMLAYWSFLATRKAAPAPTAVGAQPQPRKKKRAVAAPVPWWRKPGFLYAAALLSLTLALFAKTTASVVPAVLLVLIWWKRGRIDGKDVIPLLPFFAAGIGLAFHTAWFERTMVLATGEEWSLSFLGRVVLAGRVFAFYLGKMLLPTNLAFIYPRWEIDASVWWQWLPTIAALALLTLAWILRERVGRGPLTVLLLLGGVIFPAMGFFNVYAMRYSYVADHFAYQAVAIFAAAVACPIAAALEPLSLALRRAATALVLVVFAILGVLTFHQGRAYADEDTLWRHTLAVNPGCFMCHTNYGSSLMARGNLDDAFSHFQASLRLRRDVKTYLNLARVEELRERFDAAADWLEAALRLDPVHPIALMNLAAMNTKAGRFDEAIVQYEKALEHSLPDIHLAYNGLGAALAGKGRYLEAAEQFKRALVANPDYTP
ncbi:MAG: tetratricopeptide repeat protein, partial [Thermoanaerobaculia bacterium]|nr:tetratricopeptide repeat protein [Thermoanaerobaculia bacterium]